MRTYSIIGGVDGVGKSSFAGVLTGTCADLGPMIDTGKITAELGDLSAGKNAVDQLIRHYFECGSSFVQEFTLSGRSPQLIAQRARKLGYTIRLHYIALDSLQECEARIKNRVKRGGHIGTRTVGRQFEERWNDVRAFLPYCDEAEFYDNDNGFVKVAEYRNGELIPIGDYQPQWLNELIKHIESFKDMERELMKQNLNESEEL